MISSASIRRFALGAVLLAAPAASYGAVFISVGFAPPALPVYTQPICPGDGYLWNPGYWAYSPGGYYWVPGVWVMPPGPGVFWTPPYWGFAGGAYGFHPGYWGPHVGFYGGVNYGFGYGGVGFFGGRWNGNHFAYNTAVMNVNTSVIHNTYVDRTVIVNNNNYSHASFNGPGGANARPRPEELQAERERHFDATPEQQNHFQAAQGNRSNFASANGGHPAMAALPRAGATQGVVPAAGASVARDGFGRGNEVNARQGNQQQRINQGVNSGQLTPGETRNLQNRDASINRQAQADRQANGGTLTPQERQGINQRQNNVSNSINNDKHNGNNDAAAAARQGRTPQGEERQAQHTERNNAPQPREDHPRAEGRPPR